MSRILFTEFIDAEIAPTATATSRPSQDRGPSLDELGAHHSDEPEEHEHADLPNALCQVPAKALRNDIVILVRNKRVNK
ncbi:hypothetical protein ckrop_1463 [Corynebacterium kroppenstedtii DSM 44385]|uniref:Uncharacterized protein n=1 Tax=Corynebacterium kroppenstedtii (strain DSM 44385 / JCM 11950 / CIP 105744 / CCUG 35717) TaxID=645127 RepID=C4LK39_CORK4|nr:hypothetical protein ckrop_1463 [Corynebacterium kroppenstedtii DSM 44385]